MIDDARCVVVALEQWPRPPELAISFMQPRATGRGVAHGISGACGVRFVASDGVPTPLTNEPLFATH